MVLDVHIPLASLNLVLFLKDVQERLGHADIQTTSNIYTHVTETQNKKVINNFVAFMKNSPQEGVERGVKKYFGLKIQQKDTI